MRNNRGSTKVRGEGSLCTRADIPQQPMERTTPEHMDILQVTEAHRELILEEVFFMKDWRPWRGPTLEQRETA